MILPVTIHLLNKRRFKTIKWAATSFLFEASRSSNKKRKIKHWIILALRTLAVACLILLVARPHTSSDLLSSDSGKLDTVIVLLDRSPSMELTDPHTGLKKREAAIRIAQENLNALDSVRLVLIDSTSYSPQIIPKKQSLMDTQRTGPSDPEANIPQLLESALDYLEANATGNTEIWLLSDLQDSAWETTNPLWSEIQQELTRNNSQCTLKVIPFSESSAQALRSEVLHVTRQAKTIQIDAAVYQDASSTLEECVLEFNIDGREYNLTVPLNGTRTQFQKVFQVGDEAGYGSMLSKSTVGDSRPQYFTYDRSSPIQIALVAEDDESASYLQRATSISTSFQVESKRYDPNALLPFGTASFIVWQAPLPLEPEAQAFRDYLSSGGVMLCLPPSSEPQSSLAGHTWGKVLSAPDNVEFVISQWDRKSGPLRDGNDGVAVPVDKLRMIQRRNLSHDSTVVAAWDDGSPALTRHLFGAGELYFLNTLPNYYWSSLGDGDVLLPLVQRLISTSKMVYGTPTFMVVGDSETLEKMQLHPFKRILPVNEDTGNNDPIEYRTGVFEHNGDYLAINGDPREIDSIYLSMQEVNQLLPRAEYSDAELSESPSPIWKTFAYLTILILLGEAALSTPFSKSRQPQAT